MGITTVDQKTYEDYKEKPTRELFELAAVVDRSEKHWAALDILEHRKLRPLVDAARKSATAAKWSAIAAVISASIALTAIILVLKGV